MNEINEKITPDYIKEYCKSLCKIKIGNIVGTGFFMKSFSKRFQENKPRFLVTNCHVISDDMINSKQTLEIYLEHINEKREIQLDNEKRFIKCFPKPVDITIIEILETDNLKDKVKFLKRENFHGKEYESYLSKDIIIFHHPKGEDAVCSKGKIIKIDDYKFYHTAFTNSGSSGSAILLENGYKIIGIHCGKRIIDNINFGIFIGKLIDEITDQKIHVVHKKEDKLFSDNNLGLKPLEKDIQIIDLRYKYYNQRVRLFGDTFVHNNVNNCALVVENKEYKLCNKIDMNKMKKIGNEYEIKLKIKEPLTDLSYMFHQCNSLSPSSEINKINTSYATDISYIFSECQYLVQLPDISAWDTAKVENMACLFAGGQSLLSLPDISNWNTSNTKIMMGMFAGCASLSSIPDISKWNTNKVCKMDYMFYKCFLLKDILIFLNGMQVM